MLKRRASNSIAAQDDNKQNMNAVSGFPCSLDLLHCGVHTLHCTALAAVWTGRGAEGIAPA